MTNTHFAKGQVLFREGEPADSVFRLLRGTVDIFRELDGEPILLGTVGAGHADSQTAGASVSNSYLAAKNPWLQRQLHSPLALGDLPFIVGRAPVAGEELPPLQPDLKLDDTPPFRLSRNHLMIEKRDGSYHVRDLRSTLGTIVNGEPIGTHFRTDDAPLQAGENEVIAGGVDSPFVFSVYLS